MSNVKQQQQQFVPFPMDIKFGQETHTEFYASDECISVKMLAHPTGNFREHCFDMIMSTWQDSPDWYQMPKTPANIKAVFMQLLKGKVLPNSMEHLHFQFMIDGITLIEITHILRHRMFNSIHAQCTADRFLTNDSAFIPSGILDSEFADEYKALTIATKELYQKMVDSKVVSLMDARYILPRNHRYFYYVGMNLKDAIAFIKQRRCTAIQPELDNYLAKALYEQIIYVIPELAECLSLECDHTCHTTFGNDEHTTRLYQPDDNHRQLIETANARRGDGSAINKDNYIYSLTRAEMGARYKSR